ncbi:DNA-directed RNA polymerase III subunit rpc5 [Physcia stellaris]|nr:DNA-directed RNA polymerase III subunit rpc5 [Physcia stellaris]
MSAADALKPPPGEVINYVNSPSVGYKVVNASAATISLAILAVAIRLGVKFGVTKNPGWDDYTMVVALGFAIAQVVGNIILVKQWGVGHHSWNVPLQNYEPMLNWIIANTVLYLLAIMFAKLSILIFYYRLMGINKHFRWALYCVATLVIGYCLSLTLALIFQCTPPAAVWNLEMRPQAQCLNMVEIDVAIGAFNIPTAIVREIIVVQTLHDSDQAWNIVDSMVWLTLEINIGILCGCLPCFKPLFRHVSTKGSLGTYLRSLLTSSHSASKDNRVYGSESDGSGDHNNQSYRVLVESGKVRRGGASQAHPKGESISLPDRTFALPNGTKTGSAHDGRQGDIEQGGILVTNNFGHD